MSRTTNHTYGFGPFRLDTKDRLLQCDGERVPLTLKSFKTLLLLVENSGHVVERSELLEQVWPNTFVEEANLTQQIFTLRKVLGDYKNGRQYIETVHKLGYRFAAPVHKISLTAGDAENKYQTGAHIAANDSIPDPANRIDSIAVLPLIDGCDDFDTECLSEGVTENIISSLSQLPRLRVMALSTVLRYRGREADPQSIGRELNVRAVVTGRIIKLGANLIFRMELVDVTDGSRLWGTEYKHRFSDIVETQRDIAMSISRELKTKLADEITIPRS